MNIIELYGLTNWIKVEIVEAKIPQKYQQLQAILQQNAQPNKQKTPFETQKEDLLNALISVRHAILTKDQISFLSELSITQLIGRGGARVIEDILYRNSIDIATAANKIQELTQTLNEGIRKSGLIADGLDGCVQDDELEVYDEALIRVSFLGDAAMSNVKDFKKWGIIWHDIGRGVAMVHGNAPEDVKIIGAAKGSVILELMALAKIATTIAGVIWSALKVAEKVLDIRKKAGEIRHLNLETKKLAGDMEKAAEKEKEVGVTNIINLQIKELKLKKNGDGEKISALEKSVKNLVDFIELGGEVDFVVPEEAVSDEDEAVVDDFTKLRKTTEEIRLLEEAVKLLEDNSDD